MTNMKAYLIFVVIFMFIFEGISSAQTQIVNGDFETGDLIGFTVESVDEFGAPTTRGVYLVEEGVDKISAPSDARGLNYFGNFAVAFASPTFSSAQGDVAIATSDSFQAGTSLIFQYVDELFCCGPGRNFEVDLLDPSGSSLTGGGIPVPLNPLPSFSPVSSFEGQFFKPFVLYYSSLGIASGQEIRVQFRQFSTHSSGNQYFTLVDNIQNLSEVPSDIEERLERAEQAIENIQAQCAEKSARIAVLEDKVDSLESGQGATEIVLTKLGAKVEWLKRMVNWLVDHVIPAGLTQKATEKGYPMPEPPPE